MSAVTKFEDGICIVEINVPDDYLKAAGIADDTEEITNKPVIKKVRFQSDSVPKPCKKKSRTRLTSRRPRKSKAPPTSLNIKKETLGEKCDSEVTSCTISTESKFVDFPTSARQDKAAIDDDLCYEVEAIIGHRIRHDTEKPEFLLKWKGYPSSENSWEPPINLNGCTDMLHMYISEKVLPDVSCDHRKHYLKLLPYRLRKNGFTHESKQGTDSVSKKNGLKMATQPKAQATADHTTKNGNKQSHSARKPSKERPSFNTCKPPSKQPSHTVSITSKTSETLTPHPTNSKLDSQTIKSLKPTKKLRTTQNRKLFEALDMGQSTPPVNGMDDYYACTSVKVENGLELAVDQPSTSISNKSLDNCSLHCNGVVQSNSGTTLPSEYMPPQSPVFNFSPLSADPKEKNETSVRRESASSSLNDFSLQLSSSPASIDDSDSFSSEPDVESNHDNASLGHTHLSDPSVIGVPISDDSEEHTNNHVPMFLLHKRKVFSTPMPLPRSRTKRCWTQVPTKAAKRLSPVPQSVTCVNGFKRSRRHTIGMSEITVLSKVVKSNGVSHTNGLIHNGFSDTGSSPKVSETETSNSDSNSHFNGVTTPSPEPNDHTLSQINCEETPTKRMLESLRDGEVDQSMSAVDRYKELLLEWQHQLNKQRDGTDEFIVVENDVDRIELPFHFKYISSNHYSRGVPNPTDPEVSSSLCGCECYSLGKKCGSKSSICCPKMADAEFAYSKAGKVQVEPGTPIYECNSKCACPADCLNRVVQHGRKIPLCIFRTSDGRGWGVKTLQPIKSHTFITEYVGEVITTEEAEKRGAGYDQMGATYLFDLDFDDDNSEFTIDAYKEGNISHFFNHSCQPNLVVYSVWIESLDKRLPRIAFFTTRNVSAGEELTFDYQMNNDQNVSTPNILRQKKHRRRCLCGAEKCLGYYW